MILDVCCASSNTLEEALRLHHSLPFTCLSSDCNTEYRMFCAPEIYGKNANGYHKKNAKVKIDVKHIKHLTLECSSDEDEKQWYHDDLLVEGDVDIPSEFCLAHACVDSGLVTHSIFSVSF